MQVTQITAGRFHHFHLARQLEMRGLLDAIWTGYPRSKLRAERGIEAAKIRSFPPFLVAERLGTRVPVLNRSRAMASTLSWLTGNTLDRRVALSINRPTILVALSASGLHAGRRSQALGGHYICDRGSSHIRYQKALLSDEYDKWGIEYRPVYDWTVAKEEAEYEAADRITVPSGFVYDSFVQSGVPKDKLRLIPYGADLSRFSPRGAPDPDWFTIIFVGQVSVRKGIPYLLQAFAQFRHPKKRLRIIGSVDPRLAPLLRGQPTENVEFLGVVENAKLQEHFSTSDVMVLPSVEEGLSMVMGEALACGCPVIASQNTGAADLFEDGVEGSIVPPRDVKALVDALTAFADQPELRAEMRSAALSRVQRLGGWDGYGAHWEKLVREFS